MARPPRHRPLRETVAIVGDGQTERLYFEDIRDTDRPDNVYIFPEMPRRFGSYQGVLNRAVELKEQHSRVYALIDMDTIIALKQQVQYAKDKAVAERAGVIVLENNPCFEIWLLLHFVNTARPFSNCEEVVQELRKEGRLPGYHKTEKYLAAAKLYRSHQHLIAGAAMPRAARLEADRDLHGELYPRAEIFRFFEWYLANK